MAAAEYLGLLRNDLAAQMFARSVLRSVYTDWSKTDV